MGQRLELKRPELQTVGHVSDLECSSRKNDLIIISGLEIICWSYAGALAVNGDVIEPDLDSLEQQAITFEASHPLTHEKRVQNQP